MQASLSLMSTNLGHTHTKNAYLISLLRKVRVFSQSHSMLMDIVRSPKCHVFVEGIRLHHSIVELCNWLCVHDKRGSWRDPDEKLPQSSSSVSVWT